MNAEDFDTGAELVTVDVFGHRFLELPDNAKDLITLEREGAIYSHFWDETAQIFRYYRIAFLPVEIFQYVEAHVAKQEFEYVLETGCSFEDALAAISNSVIADRVRSYGNYGKSELRDGSVIDLRGCLAGFLGEELEALVCGQRRERYELLPNVERIDRNGLIIQQLDFFPVVARYLLNRRQNRPPYQIQNEYDVQDLLFACIRSCFEDARIEDWTPKHAGAAKRIDIVIPSLGTVVEVKIVRSANHARSIADELKIDIESYHAYPGCKTLLAFVYDPKGYMVDPAAVSKDLSGYRVKGTSNFDVQVLIRQ